MSEFRKNTAEQCLDKARSISTNATRIMVIWLFVLVSVWFFKIEPHVFGKVRGVAEAIQEKQQVQQELELLKGAEIKSGQPKYRAKLKQIKITLPAMRQKAEKIVFPVPGLGSVPIPTIYAPVFWTFLLLALLIYLLHARWRSFRYIGRAHRIYRDELQVSGEHLRSYAEGMAWWMRPLPNVDGVNCTVIQFQEFTGKEKSSVASLVGLCLFMIFIFIAEFRMGYLLWSTTGIILQGQLGRVFLLSVQLSAVVATVLLIYNWLKKTTVPDYIAAENKPSMVSRREFLFSTGILAASFLALPMTRISKRIVSVWSRNNPRFVILKVKRSQHTSLSPFYFYRNYKSGALHYVFAKGELKVPNKINESNFRKVNVNNSLRRNSISNLDIFRASVSYETAALRLLKSGNTKEACHLLLSGITYLLEKGQPSYRLADLLAGVAVRHNNHYVDMLVRSIEQGRNSQNYSQRMAKWLDVNSNWHRRWSDKSVTITWAGLPM